MAIEFNMIPFDGYHKTDPATGSVPSPIALGTTVVDRTSSPFKEYMWVQVAQSLTNSTTAANEVLTLKSATTFEVTNDVSTGLDATYPFFAGRANAAVPQSTSTITYYCWVQIAGFGTLKTDGGDDIALGELVSADETVDGGVDRITDNTTITDRLLRGLAGRAVAADTATTVAALIFRPLWAPMGK